AAAVIATVALGLAMTLPGGGGGAEAAAVRVLDRAAQSADDTVVGPRQWLHVSSETTRWGDGVPERTVQETWVPGDAERKERFRDSDGLVYVRPVELPEVATQVDADVDTVHAWLMSDSGDLRGADAALERASETLADHGTPMAFKARLFDAIKSIDGTRVVSESTEFDGREAVLLGRPDGGYETRFAFDRATGEFIGYQGVLENDDQLDYRTSLTTHVVDSLPARARTCLAIRVEGEDDPGWQAPPTCGPGVQSQQRQKGW